MKAQLGRDRGDREICMGEEAARFEREPGLYGLFGRLVGGRLRGAAEGPAGVAKRLRVVTDVVGDGEVTFEQLAKAGAEPVGIVAGGGRRVEADSQDQIREQVPQRLGLGGGGVAFVGRVRVLVA